MQSDLFIEVLVLQSERLMRVLINPAYPFSDDTKRCIRRTIRDYRPYRSSHAGCRFGRSGSSGLLAAFVVGIVAVERNTTKIV